MAQTWMRGPPSKPKLRLNGNSVIIEDSSVIDLNEKYSKGLTYRRVTTLHFDDPEDAMEYYYKNK